MMGNTTEPIREEESKTCIMAEIMADEEVVTK